jgi:subtilase family protein
VLDTGIAAHPDFTRVLHKDNYGIRILNLSLGTPVQESYTTDPLCQACETATRSGLLVVAAAGNRGRSVPDDPDSAPAFCTIDCPGNDPLVLTVGATKTMGTLDISDDAIASYSSRGPTAFDRVVKPDLVAPGNRVTSLDAQGEAGEGGDYVEMSGGLTMPSGAMMLWTATRRSGVTRRSGPTRSGSTGSRD